MSLSEDASQVAFILAFASHLDTLKAKFDAISEDPSSTIEQCCYVEELSIGLRVVKNYGLRTLANGSDASRVHSACALLNAHILGGSSRRKLLSLSTEELIGRVDDSEISTNPLIQDPQLMSKLYELLQAAVQMATDSGPDIKDPSLLESHISQLLVGYLTAQETAEPRKISLGGLSSAAIAHLKGFDDSSINVSWESVYSIFKHLLSLQVSLAPSSLASVLEAREVGNNLMANGSYPQALKVYTEAIEGAGFSALNNLPQLYTNRAIAFIGMNCFAEAVSDLQAAVVLDRTFTPAWTQLAYCHLFLGSSLLALKCYLVALRSIAGEIYPLHFPSDVSSKEEYTEAKMKAVFPQFVQKLVSSIILTEKRAEQQQEPASSIQEITTRVRAILARLRSCAAPEDVYYFSYAYETDLESTRSTAARANRVRPSILNPDVAHDLMASTSVEASAVTVSPPPLAAFAPHTVPNRSGSPQSPSATNGDAADADNQESGIRDILNNLGDVIASVIPDESPNRTNQDNTESDTTETSATGTNLMTTTLSQELDTLSTAIASAQRVFAPIRNGGEPLTVGGFEVPAGFSNIISQALINHQAGFERIRAQNNTRGESETIQTRPHTGLRFSIRHRVPVNTETGSNAGTGSNSVTGNNAATGSDSAASNNSETEGDGDRSGESAERPQRSAERSTDSPRPEDTEMPDAQDLD